jgi:hypothetical protein
MTAEGSFGDNYLSDFTAFISALSTSVITPIFILSLSNNFLSSTGSDGSACLYS